MGVIIDSTGAAGAHNSYVQSLMQQYREGKRIYDPAYRRQMAQAIVDGVKAYKNLVEQ